MTEPVNPENYYVYIGPIELEGKKGLGKVKKWFDSDDKQWKEKVLVFEEVK